MSIVFMLCFKKLSLFISLEIYWFYRQYKNNFMNYAGYNVATNDLEPNLQDTWLRQNSIIISEASCYILKGGKTDELYDNYLIFLSLYTVAKWVV